MTGYRKRFGSILLSMYSIFGYWKIFPSNDRLHGRNILSCLDFILNFDILLKRFKHIDFSVGFHSLDFFISVRSITKRSMLGSFTQTKPNIFIFWSYVRYRTSSYILFPINILASSVTKGLGMRTTTATPFV